MRKTKLAAAVLSAAIAFTTFVPTASAAVNYYHANGGSYWSQSGPEWTSVSNDGYCVSGRGPCGSSLWYQQWTYNHSGCGYDEVGNWAMASIQDANGSVSAWIDGVGGGTMYDASYAVAYNFGNSTLREVDQNAYWETFAPVASALRRITNVNLADSWGAQYACNGVSGKRVEFDEIRLEI